MNFVLADPRHEPALRRLVASASMPGLPRLSYRREPDFWQGLAVQGESSQTVVCEEDGQVAGMALRSLRRSYVNGEPRTLGYLSGLRLHPSVRNGTALARGYSFIKQLHADGQAPAYLSTVMHGNDRAEAALLSGRAGLPTYRAWGAYQVHALRPVRAAGSPAPESALRVVRAVDLGADPVTEFWQAEGPRRQFFPCWKAADLGTPLARGLTLEGLLVAVRDGAVVGTLALWDQQDFRQLWVEPYGALLGTLRGGVNAGLGILGLPGLPPPNAAMNAVLAACLLCRDDDPGILAVLLDAALDRLALEGRHSLLLGLHERDPLLVALRGRRSWTQTSQLFVVHWDDGNDLVAGLDRARVPYLELGAL